MHEIDIKKYIFVLAINYLLNISHIPFSRIELFSLLLNEYNYKNLGITKPSTLLKRIEMKTRLSRLAIKI